MIADDVWYLVWTMAHHCTVQNPITTLLVFTRIVRVQFV